MVTSKRAFAGVKPSVAPAAQKWPTRLRAVQRRRGPTSVRELISSILDAIDNLVLECPERLAVFRLRAIGRHGDIAPAVGGEYGAVRSSDLSR
jgi:hypothetical protein